MQYKGRERELEVEQVYKFSEDSLPTVLHNFSMAVPPKQVALLTVHQIFKTRAYGWTHVIESSIDMLI